MKATITVKGGIGGNSEIFNKLDGYSDWKKGNYGSYIVQYDTLTKARKSLKYAYKRLKEDEDEFYRQGGISFYQDSLTYDASKAEINY